MENSGCSFQKDTEMCVCGAIYLVFSLNLQFLASKPFNKYLRWYDINSYLPTVAVLVIFKEDFTILTHYCGFGSLAPHSNELPVVVL